IRTIRRILIIFVSSGVVLLLAVLAVLHLGADTWVVNSLVRTLIPGATTSVAEVSGNYFSGIQLRGIRIVRDGTIIFGCDTARAIYHIRELLSKNIRIRRVELVGPVVNLRQSAGGSWNPFPPQGRKKSSSPSSEGPKVIIEQFSITHGSATLQPNTRPVPLALRFAAAGGKLRLPRLTVRRLQIQTDSSIVVAGGAIDLPVGGRRLELPELDLDAGSLWLPDLAGVLPTLSPEGRARLKASFRDDGSEKSLSLVAVLRDLRIGPLQKTLSFLTPLSGRMVVDLRGNRASQFDGRAGAELFDSSGDLRVSLKLNQGKADLELAGRHGSSSIHIGGWARLFDSVPSYNLAARFRARPSQGSLLPPSKWLGNAERVIAVRLRGQGLPPHRAFGWAAARVDQPRGEPALLGSGKIEAQLNGERAEFTARAGVAKGAVRLKGTASWSSPLQLRVTRGSLERVELATILSDSGWKALSGRFSGAFDLEAAGKLRVALRSQLNQVGLRLKARLGRRGSVRTLDLTELGFEHLTLDKFRVSQRSMDLNGYGSLSAAGKTLEGSRITGNLELRDSRLEREEISRAQLTATLKHRAVLTRGEIDAGSGRLAWSGTLRPFDPEPSLRLHRSRFTDLDLGRLLNKANLTSRLSGTLAGEGEGRSPKHARIAGTLELDASSINHLALDGGRIEATLDGGQLEVVGRVRSQGDSLVIGAALAPFESRPKLKLITRVPLAQLSSVLRPNDSLETAGAAYLALSGTLGRPDSMRLQAELQADGRFGGVKLDSLRARLRLRDGMVEVDSLSIESNVGVATAAGVVGLFGAAQSAPTGLRIRARLDSLAPLASFIGNDLGLDSGRIDLTAGGSRNRLRLVASLTAHGLTRGEQRLDQLAGTAAVRLEKNHPASGTARLAARGIRTRKTSVQSIEVQASGAGGELAVQGEAVIDSRSNLRTAARLRRERQELRVQLDSLNILSNKRQWALRHPVDMLFGDSVLIDDFVLASGAHRVAVNGIINRRGDQDFQIDIAAVRIQPIAHLLGAGQLDGELNASARVKGPAAAPDVQAEWDAAVRSRDRDLGTLRGRAGWNTDGLKIDGRVAPLESDSLTLRGRLPLSLSLSSSDSTRALIARIPGGELALDADGDNVDLSKLQPLFDPEKLQLGGRLFLNAHARGSFAALRLAGDIVVRQAEFRIRPLARYHEGLIRLALEGAEARIVEGRFESGKGEARLAGKLAFDQFPRLTLDIGATVQNFAALSDDQLRASATGDVHLGGNVKNPRLSIRARLQNTDWYLKAKNLQTSAEAVELSPEDLRILEQRFGREVVTQSKKVKGLLPLWGLDWKLKLGDNVWLRRRSDPVMAVELAGNLEVRKEPNQELQAFGKIEPVLGRSFVQLMSRRFDLKSGDVTLNGPLKQTRVGLAAEYRTTEAGGSTPIVILATVKSDTGLVVQLNSRPAMREADIMSYLTTGRPAST
ncbi:MAG: translocation/assembly module TamB domain-containing protein, partial [Gemmatimonadales bacterium]